jgi:Restriction endonuclease XhoI
MNNSKLDLANYGQLISDAVRHFWSSRGDGDDNRLAVVGGKNLERIERLIEELTVKNGLPKESIQVGKGLVTIPGYYRATKQWDLIVAHEGKLIAVFEFKSQVGPSFGNNFNNRSEEVIGSAVDLWRAAKQEVFGSNANPFVGYMMFLEDCEAVRVPIRSSAPHFQVLPEFANASYEQRYKILCEKLKEERLYQATAVILSSRIEGPNGVYRDYYLKDFIASYAAHVAKIAASA